MKKEETLGRLEKYYKLFAEAKKPRKKAATFSNIMHIIGLILSKFVVMQQDFSTLIKIALYIVLIFVLPTICAKISYNGFLSAKTNEEISVDIGTDKIEGAEKVKSEWAGLHYIGIGSTFLFEIIAIIVLAIITKAQFWSTVGLAIAVIILSFIYFMIANSTLSSNKKYKNLKKEHDEFEAWFKTVLEDDEKERIEALERQKKEHLEEQRKRWEEIGDPENNLSLVKELADQGVVPACTWLGKKMFMNYISKTDTYTDSEKHEKEREIRNYLSKADSEDADAQFDLLYIRSMGTLSLDEWRELLKTAREMEEAGNLSDFLKPSLDLLLKNIVKVISKLEKLKPTCCFNFDGFCYHWKTNCDHQHDPMSCPTAVNNQAISMK